MNDLLAGHVQVYFDVIGSSKSMVETGKLKALATCGLQRSQLLPNLPTVAESGLPGFHIVPWNALFAPLDTPREIVVKLSDTVKRLSSTASYQARLRSLGMERADRAGGELETFLRAEIRRWQEVIVSGNIRP